LWASPRLFRNPLLDRLSRVHHIAPLLLYAPVTVVLLWFGFSSLSAPVVCGKFLIGYAIWTLVEYFGHRLFFHYAPRTSAGRRIQFLVHGVHHDHPSDPLRLVMPPLMSLPIVAVAWLVLRLAWGAQLVVPVLAGFVAGYMLYDALHFHVHHGTPRTRLGNWLRYRHMHHHFRDDSSWFGVSAPWWDLVFATHPSHHSRRTDQTGELQR
jgi:sterol desaturase/sphingolipid hydroxylase (fatty acid hydroxylase superfamily)